MGKAPGLGWAGRAGGGGRRLILLRHAESEAGGPAGDHGRPLSARGRAGARGLGAQLEGLAQVGWLPDLVLCSSARRTEVR